MSASRVLSTRSGDLRLDLEPAPDDLLRLANAWPNGVVRLKNPDDSLSYGIIFQRGQQEVWGLKLQQVEGPPAVANANMAANRVRASAAAARIVGKTTGASLLVGTYFRERQPGRYETGVALFPMYLGATPPPAASGTGALVTPIAPGAEPIVAAFLTALMDGADAELGQLAPFIGFDLRPRMRVGSLAFEFLVVGDWIASLNPTVDADDPRWAAVVHGGVRALVQLPSVPFVIEELGPRTAAEGVGLAGFFLARPSPKSAAALATDQEP